MVNTEYFKTRNDGVKLYRTIDAVVDEHGNPVRDEKCQLIPTGFYILQVETGIPYDEAIDVENAPYTYIETNKKIENEQNRANELQ